MDMPPLVPGRPNYNRKPRKKTAERGYGHDHEKLRAVLIKKYPVCQWCEAAWSVHYHHACHDSHCRNPDHAVMLCEACHQKAHAKT